MTKLKCVHLAHNTTTGDLYIVGGDHNLVGHVPVNCDDVIDFGMVDDEVDLDGHRYEHGWFTTIACRDEYLDILRDNDQLIVCKECGCWSQGKADLAVTCFQCQMGDEFHQQ